jgi:hypothetical protein
MAAKLVIRGLIGVLVVAAVAGVIVYSFDHSGSRLHGEPDESEHHPPPPPFVRFERASLVLAEKYRDEKVPASRWVRIARREIPEMIRAMRAIRLQGAGLEGGREQADLRTFIRLAREEIDSISELRAALTSLDARNERLAFNRWSRATNRKHSFLSDYYSRTSGISIDFAPRLPSRPLKSLA